MAPIEPSFGLGTHIILDILVVGALLFFLIRGLKVGLVMTLSGVAGLIIGLIGASFIAGILSGPISKVIVPAIEKALTASSSGIYEGVAVDSGGNLFTEARDSISGVIDASNLPKFSLTGVVDDVGAQIAQTGAGLLRAASELIAERVMYIILFIVAFIVLQIVVHLVFRAIDLVAKVPVLSTMNSWGGGILGVVKGGLILILVIWLASTLIASTTEPGGLLAEETFQKTYVTKHLNSLVKTILPGGDIK